MQQVNLTQKSGHSRGRQTQVIGRSLGGWTAKIHALTGAIGRP